MTGRTVASAAWKTLLVIHRYLGVAVGLLMVLWCLSGFVMMYHGYPRLAEAQRVKALEPVRLGAPCDPGKLGLASGIPVQGFGLEMLHGRPLLTLRLEHASPAVLDLSTCARAAAPSAPDRELAARRFAAARGIEAPPIAHPPIAFDQWTVNGGGGRGPVQRFSFPDAAHTDIYVALRTGQVALATDRADRVLGWLGAVPHWLYPTLLRQNGELWSQVVIWASLIGTFLTATGIYVGIARFRRYRSGRWSPYRGWFFWHHVTGLAFGLVTLAWVGSGLLTMSPWGLLESPALGHWRSAGASTAPGGDVARFLKAVADRPDSRVKAYEAAPSGGRLFVLAKTADDRTTRLDAEAGPAPLAQAQIEAMVRTHAAAPVSFARLLQPDAFYYPGYDEPAPLPVIRAQIADREKTRLYIDPVDGKVLRAVDSTERLSRWTRTALHDWDFPWLRARPLWDVVVLLLLAGVTLACGVGAWLSLQRAGRDLVALTSWVRARIRPPLPPPG